jgi:antitoxin CptB
LLWRCRRGMKELDVLLERYVRRRLPEAIPEERRTLARLLDLPDPLLADYLLGHAAAVEPQMARLVAAIRDTPHTGRHNTGRRVGRRRGRISGESPEL